MEPPTYGTSASPRAHRSQRSSSGPDTLSPPTSPHQQPSRIPTPRRSPFLDPHLQSRQQLGPPAPPPSQAPQSRLLRQGIIPTVLPQPQPQPQPQPLSQPQSTPQGSALSLPPNVTIEPCAPHHIPALKRLNSLLLPVKYPASFYTDIAEDPLTAELTKVAIWHDIPTRSKKATSAPTTERGSSRLIGAIRSRLEAQPPFSLPPSLLPQENNPNYRQPPSSSFSILPPTLYIQTLTLLSPYRHLGIASALLAAQAHTATTVHGANIVYAHVWEKNDEALDWYAKRGFVIGGEVLEGYYRRLNPGGARVVGRKLGVWDALLGGAGAGTGRDPRAGQTTTTAASAAPVSMGPGMDMGMELGLEDQVPAHAHHISPLDFRGGEDDDGFENANENETGESWLLSPHPDTGGNPHGADDDTHDSLPGYPASKGHPHQNEESACKQRDANGTLGADAPADAEAEAEAEWVVVD
ncbi:MAG: hypothetical protein M1819_004166 [Sarea resinae]|nr:MAG: hypothetical protein M1819_004166 [Sarea resinae]